MRVCVCILAAVAASAAEVALVTFGNETGTTFNFVEQEDPIMGSQCWGNWTLNAGVGVFKGTVTIVHRPAASIPHASPGYVKVGAAGTFADASSAAGGALVLVARSLSPTYKGFRVSIASGAKFPALACRGGSSIPLSSGCYKSTNFSIAAGAFSKISIPFDQFSDKWSPPTGEHTKTCAEDPSVCVTAAVLSAIQRIEFVAEGADGEVHVEIQSIFAEAPSGSISIV